MKLFSKHVILASIILIAFSWLVEFFSPQGQFEFSTLNYVIGLVMNALLLTLAVCLVKLVRTKPGYEVLEEKSQEELGIWGYVWRTIIIYMAALFSTALIISVLKLPIEIPSIQYTITAVFSAVVLQAILAWLIFSKDRKGQMKKIIPLLRGW